MNEPINSAERSCVPFLKWPGGKRWLAPVLSDVLRPELRGLYYEPFAGAASVFLHISPSAAVLSDTNAQLIETMRTVREHPGEVLSSVWRLSNTAECYYRMRASSPRTAVGRAARFVYLNRTCWGGVYRLNRRGEFNVPFGNTGRRLCSRFLIEAVAAKLTRATLVVSDFEPVLSKANDGDAVYADPPYTTRGENNGFVRYNESLFSWQDQTRLAAACRRARSRGAFVAVSGLYHEDVLSLYRGWWALKLGRNTRVSRKQAGRKLIHEALIVSRRPKHGIDIGMHEFKRI